jgi:hypothetical protein
MLFACGTLLYALQPVALFIGGLKKTIWQKPNANKELPEVRLDARRVS